MDEGEAIHRFEITGEMDRHAIEALTLEVRHLAQCCGFEVSDLRVEEVEDKTG